MIAQQYLLKQYIYRLFTPIKVLRTVAVRHHKHDVCVDAFLQHPPLSFGYCIIQLIDLFSTKHTKSMNKNTTLQSWVPTKRGGSMEFQPGRMKSYADILYNTLLHYPHLKFVKIPKNLQNCLQLECKWLTFESFASSEKFLRAPMSPIILASAHWSNRAFINYLVRSQNVLKNRTNVPTSWSQLIGPTSSVYQ